MECQCTHAKVCMYRYEISTAVDKVLPMVFGGRAEGWSDIEAFIHKRCKFRSAENSGAVDKQADNSCFKQCLCKATIGPTGGSFVFNPECPLHGHEAVRL